MKESYDFGLMINVRKNYGGAGMGYGMPERIERFLLRAFGLACKGNFLFGDWGYPGDYYSSALVDRDEWTDIEFAALYDKSYFIDDAIADQLSKYCGRGQSYSRPFARLIRLGHYIRPISDNRKRLPNREVDKIWKAVRGEYFDDVNLLATWFSTFFGMFYAYDLYKQEYYEWKYIPCLTRIQQYIAGKYMDYCYFT